MSQGHSTKPPAPSDHSHGSEEAHLESEINHKLIVWVGVVSLVLFALSAVAAGVILKSDTAGYEAAGMPAPAALIGQDEIGLIEMSHFDLDKRVPTAKAQSKHLLESYGWVDRAKGTIRIPIESAMKAVVAEQANPSGGGAAK